MKNPSAHDFADARYAGMLVALGVMAIWAMCLSTLLSLNIAELPLWLVMPAVLAQTFLYTGLFITAHDGMHGLIAPRHKRVNDWIGALCVFGYALFSFARLKHEHRKHHAHPGSADDPDYHESEHSGFWRWYFHFMRTYITWRQLVGMALAFNLLQHGLRLAQMNLLLFWVAPSLLSTLQLFYFGTYLPHREPKSGYRDQHRAESNDYSVLWSFLTCYHFGYHWEHHAYPHVPWWKLPALRNNLKRRAG